MCFELYYLFPFPSLDLKKQGEDVPLTVPCESWSVDYRPPKGVEVVKKYGHCYNAVLEQEKSMGEEVAQSLPLILSNPSGIERAQIPVIGSIKVRAHDTEKGRRLDTNRIPIQLETAAVRVRISVYQDLYTIINSRIFQGLNWLPNLYY